MNGRFLGDDEMLREAEIAVEELPEKVLKAAEQIESEDAKKLCTSPIRPTKRMPYPWY